MITIDIAAKTNPAMSRKEKEFILRSLTAVCPPAETPPHGGTKFRMNNTKNIGYPHEEMQSQIDYCFKDNP
jgi:hypothetical protein